MPLEISRSLIPIETSATRSQWVSRNGFSIYVQQTTIQFLSKQVNINMEQRNGINLFGEKEASSGDAAKVESGSGHDDQVVAPSVINKEATEIVASIKAGTYDIFILDNLYRQAFTNWAKKRFHATPEYIDDAWQEAMYAFYKQVKSGKLKEMTCTIKSYLFKIGYNWLAKTGRKLRRIWWSDETDVLLAGVQTDDHVQDDIWEDEKIILRAAMEQLSPQCKEMLVMRHFEEMSIEDIMKKFEYKNKNATSASISNCFANLKEIIKQLSNK